MENNVRLMEVIIAMSELKAAQIIHKEIEEYINSGEMDRELDAQITWWEKMLDRIMF